MRILRKPQHLNSGLIATHSTVPSPAHVRAGNPVHQFYANVLVNSAKSPTFSFWKREDSGRGVAPMAGNSKDGYVVDLTDSPSVSRSERVVAVEDEEDEDLKLAIALSLQQHDNEQSKDAVDPGVADQADTERVLQLRVSEQRNGLASLLGLDRRAMEAERLTRLKRKRGEEEEIVTTRLRAVSPRKVRSISPPALRRISTKLETSVPTQNDTSELSANTESTASSAKLLRESLGTPQLYPNGIVLQTHAPGYPTERTIAFPDLIAPASSLKSALLSSFIWDFDWLFPHFSTKSTNFLLVMHAKYPRERQQIEADFAGIPNIRLCFPPMEGQIHCMHSKLMLLFWKDRCRIVVPTANLMGFDWGRGSVMENMVWLIDLPLLNIADGETITETNFQRSLSAFLVAQTVPVQVSKKLDQYDFSKTAAIGFVHTIGGTHAANDWKDTGHCSLGKAVTQMGLGHAGPIEVDFVTSSVGSLNDDFMRGMYLAAQGDDGLTELTLRMSKSFPAKRLGSEMENEVVPKTAGQIWKNKFRFYFPSQQVIETSNGGQQSAGTICFSEKWWEGSKFPKGAIRNCVSVREGLLMHNKIMFVAFPKVRNVGETPYAGYAYVGSANLSESAWLVQDRVTKALRLNCRNYECGVVVPLPAPASGNGFSGHDNCIDRGDNQASAIFSNTVPLPMKIPGERYDLSTKKPWFFGKG